MLNGGEKMKAIYFNLSGMTAFFKKPDVNVFAYFTYANIHKVALLGILGAISGLGGYNQQSQNETYPQFYNYLRNIHVAIVPKGDRGYFPKKIQKFNNSVGYASKEEGGNLIVSEQWLENPEWDIYLLDDDSIDRKYFDILRKNIIGRRCVYIPYLGTNDHCAVLKNSKEISISHYDEKIEHIDSLFLYSTAELESSAFNEEEEPFIYREMLPWSMDSVCNSYEFKEMAFTNLYVDKIKQSNECFYCLDNKILYFS